MRLLRRVLAAAAVLLLLLVVVFVVLRLTLLRDLRRWTEVRLAETLRAPVALADVTLGWRGVVLRGLRVEASNRTCLEVERLSVGVDWSGLPRRDIRLTTLRVAGGRVLLRSGPTNFLPFYVDRVGRLVSGGGRRGGPLAISFAGLRLERVVLVRGGAEDTVEFLDLSGRSDGRMRLRLKGGLGGVLDLEAEGTLAATNRLDIVYRPRTDGLRRWFSEGRLAVEAAGLHDVRGVNTTRGPGRTLRFDFQGDLSRGDLAVPASVSNLLRVSSGEARVAAELRGFDAWRVRLWGTVRNLAEFVPSLEGGADFAGMLEGSFRSGRWSLAEASVTADRLGLTGILSNRLELADVSLAVRNGAVVRGQARLRSGWSGLSVRFRTGTVFAKPLRLSVEASGEAVDLADLRPARRSAGEERGPSAVAVLAEAVVTVRRLKTGKVEAEGVSVSLRNDERNMWSGRVRARYAGGTVTGSFGTTSGGVDWTGRVEGLDLGRLVSGLRSALSAEGKGRWSRSSGLEARFDVSSGQLVWRGLEFSGLSAVVTVTGARVRVRNIAASFHSGSAKAQADYDLSEGSGEFTLSAEGVRAETLYPVLVKDEPEARLSGRASLEAKGGVKGKETRIQGRLTLGKGVVRDTRYQKELDRLLSTDAFNDLVYDQVRADFTVSPEGLEVSPLLVTAPEFEVEMTLKRPAGGPGRSVVDLYLTDDFLNRLPNVLKVPVAVVSRKERKWTWIRLEEAGGTVKAVRPSR